MKRLIYKILIPIQYLLVILFIIFEEFIWEGVAKPIARYLASLKIAQRLEQWLVSINRYVILIFFLLIFALVELAGIMAGLLMVRGMLLAGLMLYALKIPIAAFTFWLFRVTKEKLLSFVWFAWAYRNLLELIDRLKDSAIYKRSLEIFYKIKRWQKGVLASLKELFFPQDSKDSFIRRLKALYRKIKEEIRRNRL